MSKKIVIIESDAPFAQKLRGGLEEKGFSVEETPDGKAAVELVRKEKPDLVILSVELAAGQSGYIVCGKLKKDDELKKIPIIIIGKDAEGFEAHKRLKARAEDYLKKPFEPPAIIEKIKDLIGLPVQETDDLVLDEDESLGLASLGEDEPLVEEQPEAEIVEESTTRDGDPDLDMLDAAFDDLSEPVVASDSEQPVEAPPDEGLVEEPPALEGEPLASPDAVSDADAALDALHLDDDKPAEDEIALESLEPMGEPAEEPVVEPVKPKPAARPVPRRVTPAPAPSPVAAKVAVADHAELEALRERVEQLEARERELTDELNAKSNEFDALKSTSGGKDKEYFSLKEQNTKKDKEILRLKQDLNEKEQEVVELKEKQNQFEQQASEASTELAKRDAHVKTLTQRVEAYAADRKKLDAAHNATKDELRQLSAKLATAQGELDQAQDAMSELQREVESARQEAESARAEAESTKAELESAKAEAETARTELAGSQAELEQVKADHQAATEELEQLKPQADRVAVLEEEANGLRARVAELEGNVAKSEERVVKAYQKIKSDEKMREKTKKALAVAMQILEESAAAPSDGADGSGEEVAAG